MAGGRRKSVKRKVKNTKFSKVMKCSKYKRRRSPRLKALRKKKATNSQMPQSTPIKGKAPKECARCNLRRSPRLKALRNKKQGSDGQTVFGDGNLRRSARIRSQQKRAENSAADDVMVKTKKKPSKKAVSIKTKSMDNKHAKETPHIDELPVSIDSDSDVSVARNFIESQFHPSSELENFVPNLTECKENKQTKSQRRCCIS